MSLCAPWAPPLQVEREARYHEFVSQQPFKSIDVLDERYRNKILKRIGRDTGGRMAATASGGVGYGGLGRRDMVGGSTSSCVGVRWGGSFVWFSVRGQPLCCGRVGA